MAKKHSEANLNEVIKIKSGFQSSVNIAYDIDRIDKISDFIATKSSVEKNCGLYSWLVRAFDS